MAAIPMAFSKQVHIFIVNEDYKIIFFSIAKGQSIFWQIWDCEKQGNKQQM